MRRAVLVTLIIGVAIGGVFAGLLAGGVFGQGKTPPQESEKPAAKRTVEALMTLEQATAEAAPRAPKVPLGPSPTPRLSCLDENALHPKTGIFPSDPGDPVPPLWHGPMTGRATAIGSNGVAYTIVAGSVHYLTNDASLQGTIMVILIEPDACASRAGLAPQYETHLYSVPFTTGSVTLTRTDGDMVVFQTVDGTTGRLNYVRGTFQ
jgi:hypothetical protein